LSEGTNPTSDTGLAPSSRRGVPLRSPRWLQHGDTGWRRRRTVRTALWISFRGITRSAGLTLDRAAVTFAGSLPDELALAVGRGGVIDDQHPRRVHREAIGALVSEQVTRTIGWKSPQTRGSRRAVGEPWGPGCDGQPNRQAVHVASSGSFSGSYPGVSPPASSRYIL